MNKDVILKYPLANYRLVKELAAERIKAKVLATRLSFAIEHYMYHHKGCNSQKGYDFPDNICNCGYTDFLKNTNNYLDELLLGWSEAEVE